MAQLDLTSYGISGKLLDTLNTYQNQIGSGAGQFATQQQFNNFIAAITYVPPGLPAGTQTTLQNLQAASDAGVLNFNFTQGQVGTGGTNPSYNIANSTLQVSLNPISESISMTTSQLIGFSGTMWHEADHAATAVDITALQNQFFNNSKAAIDAGESLNSLVDGMVTELDSNEAAAYIGQFNLVAANLLANSNDPSSPLYGLTPGSSDFIGALSNSAYISHMEGPCSAC